MRRLARLVAVCFAVIGIGMPLPAAAVPTLYGGQIYYTGGDINIEVLYNHTVFGEVLQLRSALAVLDVVDGSQVGSRVTLTMDQLAAMGINVGDELQFGIHVRDTGHDFFLGSGDRNADGVDHAYVMTGRNSLAIGFEDLYGGGDRDYNDTIFRFSGGASSTAPSLVGAQRPTTTALTFAVTEPSALLLLLSGIGLLALQHRRK